MPNGQPGPKDSHASNNIPRHNDLNPVAIHPSLPKPAPFFSGAVIARPHCLLHELHHQGLRNLRCSASAQAVYSSIHLLEIARGAACTVSTGPDGFSWTWQLQYASFSGLISDERIESPRRLVSHQPLSPSLICRSDGTNNRSAWLRPIFFWVFHVQDCSVVQGRMQGGYGVQFRC